MEDYETALKDIIGASRLQENDSCISFEMPIAGVDRPTHFATSTDSTICQGLDVPSALSTHYPSLSCYQGMDVKPVVTDTGYFPNGVCPQFWRNEEPMGDMKVDSMGYFADTMNMTSGMHLNTNGRMSFHNSQFMPADSGYPSFPPKNFVFEDSKSMHLSTCTPYISSEGQSFNVKAEGDAMTMPYQNSFHNDDVELNAGQEVKQLPGIFPFTGCQSYDFFKGEDSEPIVTAEEANYYQGNIDETANKFPGNMGNLNLKSSDRSLSIARESITSRKQYNCVKSEVEGKSIEHRSIDCQLSKRSTERSYVEDDSDVCIIEDISHPAPKSQSAELGNSLNMSQSSRFGYTQPHMVVGTRPKTRDEQYILRVALQVGTFTLGVSILGIPCQFNSPCWS